MRKIFEAELETLKLRLELINSFKDNRKKLIKGEKILLAFNVFIIIVLSFCIYFSDNKRILIAYHLLNIWICIHLGKLIFE